MKLNEIITESQLQEGPLLNKIGSAIGKGVGTLAKGVGAVAGGVAGVGSAFKKGYAAGKGTVGSAGDDDADNTAQAPASKPAAQGSTTTKQAAPAQSKAAPSTSASAAPTAKPTQAKAAPAAKTKPTTAAEPDDRVEPTMEPAAQPAAKSAQPAANDTQYAQAQKAIAALKPEEQKQILAALQADTKVKAAIDKAAQSKQKPATAPATPAAQPAAPTAEPAAPTAEPAPKKTKGRKKPAGPSQSEIDADRERIMGVTSDSIIRTKKSMVESIDEAGLMAKLGSKVGQAAHAAGSVAGKTAAAVDTMKADPQHAKNLVKAFATGQTAPDASDAPPIEDRSGTVPRPIIEKINQLNLEQRAELHKLITQKTV